MITSETLRGLTSSDDNGYLRPAYLFCPSALNENVDRLRREFSCRNIDRLCLGYSVKTNPHHEVLQAVRRLDMYAEIVSPHELELALAEKFQPRNIIYNGVIPDPKGKFYVAQHGGIVNLESYLEFEQLERKAAEENVAIDVGIRLNLNIGNNRKSRFGVSPESQEFRRILDLVEHSQFINIVGVHSHVYGGRQPRYWSVRVKKAAEIANKLNARYIDLGSNMFGPMDVRMAEQFEEQLPTFDDYAVAVEQALVSVYGNSFPLVILEPGTPVIANAVSVLAQVVNIRCVCGQNIATANCTEYDFGFTPATKNVPVDVIHNNNGHRYKSLDIYGYTCTEGDVLHRGYSGELAVGDYLLFRNLGAYSVSLSNSFIGPPMDMLVLARENTG